MKLKQSRIYEITDPIDNWLENWMADSSNFNPNSFNFDEFFKTIKLKKTEAKELKQFYKNETADYDELERMPSNKDLNKMSEYDRDQWLQLKEAYSHVKLKDIKIYQTAINNLLNAADNVIQ